jgi:hypothetical protein
MSGSLVRCPAFHGVMSHKEWLSATREFLVQRGTTGARVWEIAASVAPASASQTTVLKWIERRAREGRLALYGVAIRQHRGPRTGGRVYYASDVVDQVDSERRQCPVCDRMLPRVAYALVGGTTELHQDCHECASVLGNYESHTRELDRLRQRYHDRVSGPGSNRERQVRPRKATRHCRDCGGLPWRRQRICRGCGQPYAPEPAVALMPESRIGNQHWL